MRYAMFTTIRGEAVAINPDKVAAVCVTKEYGGTTEATHIVLENAIGYPVTDNLSDTLNKLDDALKDV